VIDADNCSLEQAPEVLDTHYVDVSIDERLGMADSFMLSVASGLSVALEFIGDKQFGIDTNEGIKEWGERIDFEVLDETWATTLPPRSLNPTTISLPGAPRPRFPPDFLPPM